MLSRRREKVRRASDFRKHERFYNKGQWFECIYVSVVLHGEVFMVADAVTGADVRWDLKFNADDMLALDKDSDRHVTPVSAEKAFDN